MKKEDAIDIINTWENLNFYIQQISKHPEDLKVLFDIASDDSKQEYWRAAYLIDRLADDFPDLIEPCIPDMINALKKTNNTSKVRHYLKLISQYPINKEEMDFLFNYCLDAFTNTGFPVAVRVHAMQVLYEISEVEPGLKPELIHIIENEMELHPTPGIKTRGRKLIQKLRKYHQPE